MPYYPDVYHGWAGQYAPHVNAPLVAPNTPAGWGGNGGLSNIGPTYGTKSNPSGFISSPNTQSGGVLGGGGRSSYLLPNYGTGGLNSDSPSASNFTPSGLPSNNASAVSRGTGFGTIGPDLSYANPQTLARLQRAMSGSTYSFPAGGYVPSNAVNFTGSYYNMKVGVPNSWNQPALQYYNYLGSLPTRNYGTLALQRLYQSTGTRPAQGPSFNQIGGRPYQGPYPIG